jgi:hypothetical protein
LAKGLEVQRTVKVRRENGRWIDIFFCFGGRKEKNER